MSLRLLHSQDVVAASRHLRFWIGALNALVLLTFSVCVALSVYLAHAARIRPAVRLLVLLFLCIKGVEYCTEYSEGLLPLFSRPVRFLSSATKLFMDLYLISTALHAVHVTIGIVLFRQWMLAAADG